MIFLSNFSGKRRSDWLILNFNSEKIKIIISSLQMRSHLIPADYGILKPIEKWIRTDSDLTWAE